MSVAPFKNDAELVAFARKFFANRVETFCKDIAICKTPDARGEHAYFPALIICIAFADLLSGLYAGKLHRHGLKELKQYAAKFMEPNTPLTGVAWKFCMSAFVTRLRIWHIHTRFLIPTVPHRKHFSANQGDG
jgi:hypothetical protein